jgi:xanthine dehydrogenase accessory factor
VPAEQSPETVWAPLWNTMTPMYGVAISAISCLRAGTSVHMAWLVEAEGLPDVDPTEAVAITPGGGRMGTLASGLLDTHLADLPAHGGGAVVRVEMSGTDALIAGLPEGGRATLAVVPGAALPEEIWPLLLERRPLAVSALLVGNRLSDITLHLPGTEDEVARELLEGDHSASVLTERRLVTAFVPVPRLALFGGGPIAGAIADGARLLGWHVAVSGDPDVASGHMAGLAGTDAAVVMGHDVESSSRVLAAAIDSAAGYIGSLGSLRMQQQRADWLAYRGVTDLDRVHGPAGIDIAARTPAEIALSVLAEAVAVRNRSEILADRE